MPAAHMDKLPSPRNVLTNTNCTVKIQREAATQFKMARILQDLLDSKSKSLGDFSSVGAKEVQAQHQLWGLPHAYHLKATVVLTITWSQGTHPTIGICYVPSLQPSEVSICISEYLWSILQDLSDT